MSFSTIRSADRSSLHRDRSAEAPWLPTTERVAAAPSLPRHLLVSLAGITADITSLQPRCVDAPQLHAALGAVLGRLDGLVDDIYECAANPAAPSLHRSGSAAVAPPDAPSGVPGEFEDADSSASSPAPA